MRCRSLRMLALSSACFGLLVTAAWASKVRDDSPKPIRDYLTRALEEGKKDQPKRVELARKAVADAEKRLEEVRKEYRKRKASDKDLQAALAAVEKAKDELKRVQAETPLKHTPLAKFDAADQVGTLPHGYGVSKVVSNTSALVYPFVEKRVKSDDKMFTDNASVEIEIVPSAKPLLLVNIDTADLKDGARVPADPDGVFQTGAPRTVDETSYQTLERVNLADHLRD